MELEKQISCPYNKAHRFAQPKLHDHILRCKEAKASKEELFFCSSNYFVAFIGEKGKMEHYMKCSSCRKSNNINFSEMNIVKKLEDSDTVDSFSVVEESNGERYRRYVLDNKDMMKEVVDEIKAQRKRLKKTKPLFNENSTEASSKKKDIVSEHESVLNVTENNNETFNTTKKTFFL